MLVIPFACLVAASINSAPALNIDANGNALGDSCVDAAKSEASLSGLPFETNEGLRFGAVTESAAPVAGGGEDEATNLAKQLANPISSLISVPFQANEDFGYGPSHNGYKFTLNIQPVRCQRNRDPDLASVSR